MKSLVRTIAPTAEPVSLVEAKAYLRVDSADDNTFITALIAAARESVENFTTRALLTQTWRLTLSEWPCASRWWANRATAEANIIRLDRTPLATVVSVKYFPADGSGQTTLDSAAYHVLTDQQPGMMVLKSTETWPDLYDRPDAVEVIFTAGEAAPESVPQLLRSALLLMLSHLYENRQIVAVGNIVNELPYSIKNILESHRVGGFVA